MLKRVDFDAIVDHLALMHIIKSKVELVTTRIKSLLEILSSYSFNVYYIKGKDMILSDFLSRQKHDNSNPHEIISISCNMQGILQTRYYNLTKGKTEIYFENIKLNILLKHSKYGRKGNFPQWDSNPMHLVCQTSTLTARPQRIPTLPITYPSDLLCSHWTVTIIYKTSSVHPIRACVTTVHLFCASVWMAYHHLNNNISQVFYSLKILS